MDSYKKYLIKELKEMGISDDRVLDAIYQVPREKFVPNELVQFAYKNAPMAIGYSQTISQPYMVALMTEILQIKKGMKVLEIGTGSGYQAAILAYLGANVYTLERINGLYLSARARLNEIGFNNIKCFYEDGFKGLPEYAPYERIIITAAIDDYPHFLEEQLNHEDGLLLSPVGEDGAVQQLYRVSYNNNERDEGFGIYCRFVPMKKGLIEE